MVGWLINDALGMIEGSQTFWELLLTWLPGLVDQTGGYTPYEELPARIARLPGRPDYVVRNATFFPPLPVRAPTIAFLQDVLLGEYRLMQLEVCRRAAATVVNSAFTAAQYPELPAPRVIPIGVDPARFFPSPGRGLLDVPPQAVCFIGSSDKVKGFTHVERLIAETTLNFCLVMKDDTEIQIPGRVVTFTRVPHWKLARIINSCAIGFCPSIRETQHLAGLEMGFCGLPLVTSDVGVYYRRPAGIWGERVEPDEYEAALHHMLANRPHVDDVAAYWQREGFTVERCRVAWQGLVEGVCATASRSRVDVSSTVRGLG